MPILDRPTRQSQDPNFRARRQVRSLVGQLRSTINNMKRFHDAEGRSSLQTALGADFQEWLDAYNSIRTVLASLDPSWTDPGDLDPQAPGRGRP